MHSRLLSHSLAGPSTVLAARPTHRPAAARPAPLRRLTVCIAAPVPPSSRAAAAASMGQIVPSMPREEQELRVTTVHSPAELQSVLEANADKLVVLMAKAKGCRPCRLFARKYARAAELYNDAVFLEIFGDETPETRKLMISMKVKVTPTFVLYRGTEQVHSHGGVNENNFHKAIQAHLKEGEAGFGAKVVADGDETDED